MLLIGNNSFHTHDTAILMHLSIDCPTYPVRGKVGRRRGLLTFFVTKTTPRGRALKTRSSTACNDPVMHDRARTVSRCCCSCLTVCIAMSIEQPAVLKQAMVHFKDRKFSEELCRLVGYSGGKSELVDAILREFADMSLKSKENMILQVCTSFYIVIWI